ncbi:poly adp-ribose polymerase family member parp [Anaeramoeba flamelloides]|uniref:Poly adp-ribose polymerase family member parp n=1 Tax=Anaeramoeba flamelloides TaxID=1746091 RepID=A0AAV7Z5Y6_9EUKA|nr:poly adp-ribose polymerase family member parp [Anaeramoeba flamelloides]
MVISTVYNVDTKINISEIGIDSDDDENSEESEYSLESGESEESEESEESVYNGNNEESDISIYLKTQTDYESDDVRTTQMLTNNSLDSSYIENENAYETTSSDSFEEFKKLQKPNYGFKILLQDFEECKKILKKTQIEYFEKLKSLKMNLDVSFLGPNYADALGIDETKPISLILDFPETFFENNSNPKIELYQGESSKKQSFGLQFQLREIINAFFDRHSEYYKQLILSKIINYQEKNIENSENVMNVKKIEREKKFFKEMKVLKEKGNVEKEKEKEKEKRKEKGKEKEKEKEKENQNENENESIKKPFWDQEKADKLELMGFGKFESLGAIILAENDLKEAINMLVENERTHLDECGRQAIKGLRLENNNKQNNTTKTNTKNENYNNNFGLQGEVRNSLTNRNQIASSKEVNLDTFIPGDNFILDIYDYATARVTNCTNYCMMCGEWLKTKGLKPTCCDKTACIFRHQELGLGVNVCAEIAKTPDLVDFIITTAIAAASSQRCGNIFNPFPPEFIVSNGGGKDFRSLIETLNTFPSVDEMFSIGRDEMKLRKFLDTKHKKAYSLLRWLLTTNRSHLIKIPLNLQLEEFGTNYQWVLLSSHPTKEAKFLQLKKKYKKSVFAFHGSPVENWFSILRTGLKNYSNTQNMISGAVHGAGIYLAANPSTSVGFARSGKGWSKSRFGSGNFHCMAVCEIIRKGQQSKSNVYVIPNEDLVMTRIFLLNFQNRNIRSLPKNYFEVKIPLIMDTIKKTRW